MNHISTEILFDKFEVIECLKKDSHTSVYLANHIYLGKKIILKTLNTDDLTDKTILERFKREAKILARLEHPNLIKVLDFGTYSHFFYISFEYFDSRNLRAVIKNNNLTVDNKNDLVIQLLRALNAAHQNQVIHRDIKPENILVNAEHQLKIADFGLALILDDHILTQKSSIVGTPGYMSPEQIRGETLTPQSDLFSAGLVAYELYTGSNPVIGKDISETINRILNFDESKLENINKLPEEPGKVIRGMLKKNSVNRLKSASDCLALLGINATVYDIPKEVVSPPVKKKKIQYYYIILTAILIIFIAWLAGQNFVNKIPDDDLTEKEKLADSLVQPQQTDTDDRNSVSGTEKETAPKTIPENVTNAPGTLKVEVFPWAYIRIDDKEYGSTPLQEAISLKPGRHIVRITHPDFPEYSRRISIKSGANQNIKINFNEIVGFLSCKIEPWGDIYINNVHKGTTPLKRPIVLLPGSYLLTVTNPAFGRREKRIRISEKTTTTFELNFNSVIN